jgi:hypothetical protein
MSESLESGRPTAEDIERYLGAATDDQLLEFLWQAVSSSEASLQLLLTHIDTDSGSAHEALQAAVHDVTASEA